MPDTNRKQREFDRRQEEILEASLGLFQSNNWETVTIDAIAQAAGIGKGTVYKHFRSKNEIYAQLALGFYQGMLARMRTADLEGPLVDRLRALLHTVFDYHLAHPQYRNITQYCERVDIRASMEAELVELFDGLDREFDHFAGEILADAIREGELPAQPPGLQILGIRATFSGAFAFLWTGAVARFIDNETLIEQIISYMIAGLLHQHEYNRPAPPAPGVIA